MIKKYQKVQTKLSYFDRLQIISSRFLNVLLGGSHNQMLSSRVYQDDIKYAVFIIDCIFFWEANHCKACYEWELDHMILYLAALSDENNIRSW